jgi:hypothetical protein
MERIVALEVRRIGAAFGSREAQGRPIVVHRRRAVGVFRGAVTAASMFGGGMANRPN